MLSRVLFAVVLLGITLQHSVGKLTKLTKVKPSYDGELMSLSFYIFNLSCNSFYTSVSQEHSLANRLELVIFFVIWRCFTKNINYKVIIFRPLL